MEIYTTRTYSSLSLFLNSLNFIDRNQLNQMTDPNTPKRPSNFVTTRRCYQNQTASNHSLRKYSRSFRMYLFFSLEIRDGRLPQVDWPHNKTDLCPDPWYWVGSTGGNSNEGEDQRKAEIRVWITSEFHWDSL